MAMATAQKWAKSAPIACYAYLLLPLGVNDIIPPGSIQIQSFIVSIGLIELAQNILSLNYFKK
jgi:hypothetical protein